MKNADSYGLTWQDVLFGLTGSTVFVIALQYFIGF